MVNIAKECDGYIGAEVGDGRYCPITPCVPGSDDCLATRRLSRDEVASTGSHQVDDFYYKLAQSTVGSEVVAELVQ